MKHRDLKCWEEFEDELRRLRALRATRQESIRLIVSELLFRGPADHRWHRPRGIREGIDLMMKVMTASIVVIAFVFSGIARLDSRADDVG